MSACGLRDRGWGTEPSSGPHLQSPAPDPVSIVTTSTVRRTPCTLDTNIQIRTDRRGRGDIRTKMSHFHANKYQNCTLFSSSEICKIRHDIFNSPRVLWIQNVRCSIPRIGSPMSCSSDIYSRQNTDTTHFQHPTLSPKYIYRIVDCSPLC